ncbi:MAG: TIM-barrel domain-containing protein [Myxococcota bacterium]
MADASDALDGEADSTDVDADAGQPISPDSCNPVESSDGTTPSDFDVNGWSIRIMADGAWTLTDPNDVEALTGPGICEQGEDGAIPFARVARGEPHLRSVFGAFQIHLHGNQSDLEWFAPRGIPQVQQSDGTVRMTWDLPEEAGADTTASLTFAPEKDSNLAVALETSADDMNTGELAMNCTADEAFFGLGSQVTGMDLRPGNYPLWTQEQGNGKPEENNRFPINNIPEAAYAPMGVWHSSNGYSAIIGHDAYSELDLCETHDDRAWLRSHQAMPSFVLVAGETPRDRLTEITEYTGRLSVDPPDWVFSTWVDAVDGAWRIEDVVSALRDNEISASAVWTEDWIGSAPTTSGFRLTYEWTWDQSTYPDLDTRIQGLHDDGLAFLGYFNPFVPDTVSHFQEGVDNGYLITDEDGEVYTFKDPATRDASLVDLTNPEAVAWLQGFQKTAADDLGIDGWMADFAEWLPVDAQLDSGVSGWQFHNRYPLAWQDANRGSLSEVHSGGDANNWTYFARSGWASVNGGTAGIVPAMWGGDQDTDWAYDDGFPTIFPIGANLGMAGVAIYGSDIAGYNSIATVNTDKELFFRWSAAAAFHPLMRTHHGGDECDNWSFDQDTETIQHFRRYAAVHALLYPYFQALLPDAKDRGWPITRHPYLVEPDRPALWGDDDYEWFVGDDILVAPVLEEGSTERVVTLPADDWWPLFGDAPVDSTTEINGNAVEATVDADVTETPAFVRPGTALPLLSRAVDSFYGVANPQLTDLGDVDGQARLALYPAADGSVSTVENAPVSATGTGWTDTSSLDVTTAAVDGQDLEACGSAGNPDSCHRESTRTIRVEVDGETTVSVGGAELILDAATPTTVTFGVGGDAWAGWNAPTNYSGPNPDAPSWCEDAPADE